MGGDAHVTLTWPAVPGAMRYNVKRSLTSGGPYDVLAPDVSGITYTDSGLVNGTAYYYVISAENSLGESGEPARDVAPPVAQPSLRMGAPLRARDDVGEGHATFPSAASSPGSA